MHHSEECDETQCSCSFPPNMWVIPLSKCIQAVYTTHPIVTKKPMWLSLWFSRYCGACGQVILNDLNNVHKSQEQWCGLFGYAKERLHSQRWKFHLIKKRNYMLRFLRSMVRVNILSTKLRRKKISQLVLLRPQTAKVMDTVNDTYFVKMENVHYLRMEDRTENKVWLTASSMLYHTALSLHKDFNEAYLTQLIPNHLLQETGQKFRGRFGLKNKEIAVEKKWAITCPTFFYSTSL